MTGIFQTTEARSDEGRRPVYQTYSRDSYCGFLDCMNKYEKSDEIPLDPTGFDIHCIMNGDIFTNAGLDKKKSPDGCVSTDELGHLLRIPYQDASAMIMQGKIYAKTGTSQGSSNGEQPFRVPASAILFHLDIWEQNYDLPQIKAMLNSWMDTKHGRKITADQFFQVAHRG